MIILHVLPNISRSKGNQKMKFAQLIKIIIIKKKIKKLFFEKMKNIFL